MNNEEFVNALTKMRDGAAKTDWDAVKTEWLSAVEELLSSMKSWLEDLTSQNLVSIRDLTTTLDEEALGQYDAPAMQIVLPSRRVVWIKPVLRLVLGGTGRVDMRVGVWESATHSLMLIRGGQEDKPTNWRIVRSVRNPKENVDLDEASFRTALRELLNA